MSNKNWWLCHNRDGTKMAVFGQDGEIEVLVRTGMWDVERAVVMSKDSFDELLANTEEDAFELGFESGRQ